MTSFVRFRNQLTICVVAVTPWLFTTMKTGMPYESSLVTYSIDRGFLLGFIFPDPIRPFTSVSYHIATQLSLWITNGQGDYTLLQIFYISLVAFRSIAFYELLKRIGRYPNSISLAASLFLTLYSVDGATLWIGQMNQIWASTLALWSLNLFSHCLIAGNKRNQISELLVLTASMSLAFISIWSYDTIALPLTIMASVCYFLMKPAKDAIFVLLAYLLLPFLYFVQYTYHLLNSVDVYRNSLMSTSINLQESISNIIWMISKAFDFSGGISFISNMSIRVMAIVFAVTLFSSLMLLLQARVDQDMNPAAPRALDLVALIVIASCMYLPFSFLVVSKSLWRTHLISIIPSSMILAFLLFALTFKFNRALRIGSITFGYFVLALVMTLGQFERGNLHREIWNNHKAAVLQIDTQIKCGFPLQGLLVVLPPDDSTGGTNRSPFGDNYWLRESIKLQYDIGEESVTGYLSSTGTFGPGVNLEKLRNAKSTIISIDRTLSLRELTNLRNTLKAQGISTEVYTCGNTIKRNSRYWYS